jgi:hypothetical protein
MSSFFDEWDWDWWDTNLLPLARLCASLMPSTYTYVGKWRSAIIREVVTYFLIEPWDSTKSTESRTKLLRFIGPHWYTDDPAEMAKYLLDTMDGVVHGRCPCGLDAEDRQGLSG